jgi:magnesium transporter
MREAYQAQIDLQQNELMRLFTVITALFLPLTLLVGWYGMNFQGMPELTWKYGYPAVIGLSVLISAGLILWFKWKHWL